MVSDPSTVDRIESASNITLTIAKSAVSTATGGDGGPEGQGTGDILKIPISSLDRTKDIEITEHRESSVKASGYSIDAISFSGSMMFKGDTVSGGDVEPTNIEDIVFDGAGLPEPFSITISHELSGKAETFEDCLVTSSSYEVQSESETETAFDWIAMDKQTSYPEA